MFKIRCNSCNAPSLWCSTFAACANADYTCRFVRTSVYVCMHVETPGFLFTSQYLCGTILVTMYSVVWTDRFQEQGQCCIIGLSYRLLFYLLCSQFRFFFFNGCVLSSYGLWADRVSCSGSLTAVQVDLP